MSAEIEKVIPALSDVALLEMLDSDPATYLPEALVLARATVEARGGIAALQARVLEASQKVCPSCQNERPPKARFCPECGTPLSQAPPSPTSPHSEPFNPPQPAAVDERLTEALRATSAVNRAAESLPPASSQEENSPGSACDLKLAPVPGNARATQSRRHPGKLVAASLAGAAMIAIGTIGVHVWTGRGPHAIDPALPVHARERPSAGFVSAVDRCQSIYEATAGAARPQLAAALGSPTQRGKSPLSKRIAMLRLEYGGPIAKSPEALIQARTKFEEIKSLPGVPPSMPDDFERWVNIISRNQEFFSGSEPPERVDEWCNDYLRMQAIHARLLKNAAQIDGLPRASLDAAR